MRTNLQIKQVKNLSDFEFSQCRRYNMWGQGDMKNKLKSLRQQKLLSYAVMIWDEDKKELLGWALVFSWATEFGFTNVLPTTYFYVRKEYRRLGLGTRLVNAVNKRFGDVQVEAWDSRSIGFFSSNPSYSSSHNCLKAARSHLKWEK